MICCGRGVSVGLGVAVRGRRVGFGVLVGGAKVAVAVSVGIGVLVDVLVGKAAGVGVFDGTAVASGVLVGQAVEVRVSGKVGSAAVTCGVDAAKNVCWGGAGVHEATRMPKRQMKGINPGLGIHPLPSWAPGPDLGCATLTKSHCASTWGLQHPPDFGINTGHVF